MLSSVPGIRRLGTAGRRALAETPTREEIRFATDLKEASRNLENITPNPNVNPYAPETIGLLELLVRNLLKSTTFDSESFVLAAFSAALNTAETRQLSQAANNVLCSQIPRLSGLALCSPDFVEKVKDTCSTQFERGFPSIFHEEVSTDTLYEMERLNIYVRAATVNARYLKLVLDNYHYFGTFTGEELINQLSALTEENRFDIAFTEASEGAWTPGKVNVWIKEANAALL